MEGGEQRGGERNWNEMREGEREAAREKERKKGR